MIIKFHIFERLGYNEEVSKLSEYIWQKYKQGEREINLNSYTKQNMSIFINQILINEYSDKNSSTRMSISYNNVYYKNTKNIRININKVYKPTLMSLEHEIKHAYDFVKRGGYLKMKDINYIAPFANLSSKNKDINIENFFYMMYIIQMVEIEAYFHSDVRNFLNNKHKYNNDIKKYIKYSRLKENLNFINKNDIVKLLTKIDRKDKNDIINVYNKIRIDYKYFDLEGMKYKFNNFKDKIVKLLQDLFIIPEDYVKYTDEEIDKFYDKFIKEVEKKKKIYLKYIGRLYSYFS